MAYSNQTVLSRFFSPSIHFSVRLNLNGSIYTETLLYCKYSFNVGLSQLLFLSSLICFFCRSDTEYEMSPDANFRGHSKEYSQAVNIPLFSYCAYHNPVVC